MIGRDPTSHVETLEETHVFFSYSRDDRARAEVIIRQIEDSGFAVWWDGLLEGGERFSQKTAEALDRAAAVVVLWSKFSCQSHWVHDEATRGRDRRILVPLSLDGSLPPLGFGQFQAIDLSRSRLRADDPAIQQMIRAIALLQGAERPPMSQLRAVTKPLINRRILIGGSAAAFAAAAGAAAWFSGLFGGNVSSAFRVVILPFNNVGGNPEQNYIAEGLANEIRTMLSQNAALEVVGQASSEAFARGKDDAIAFARKLRAGFLVDGSVQIVSGILRVSIELIDGKTGVTRSNRPFVKPMGNILAVQSEIGSAIAAELSSKIGMASSLKASPGGTNNILAYDHYLRGLDLYAHARDEVEERQAVTQFDAAIAADPEFAAAHSGRARSLAAISGQYGGLKEIKLLHDAAIASGQKAVDLAPRFADAQSTLGLLLFQGNLDAKAARKPFDLSRTLGEGEAPVMARFALYAASTGRDGDAVSAVERALLIDPLNALIHRIAGTVHFAARRYPEAIAAFRQTLSINPEIPDCHSRIGMVLLAQNKASEALKSFEADSHKWSKLSGVAIAQNRLGNAAAAKAAMAALVSDTDTVSLYQQGQVLAQWGDTDAAVRTLQLAYKQRDAGLTSARYDPMLDPLRKGPAFISLLKSMGLA
ncbi:TIR domain-containing protein [Sphingorhabdus sp.]|uniref:TIR domain-containing protein n=2 Tax=Sphingorhabdus sp. TaxID=1902408 RepID=UPI003BB16774